jgi:hypothetical protein
LLLPVQLGNESLRGMKDVSSDEVAKLSPIIVDLGKIGNAKVKDLKKGQGVFLEEVLPAVDQVRTSLGHAPIDPNLPFVVVIYERKSKKLKGLFPLFPS